jgi:hypothetical protein
MERVEMPRGRPKKHRDPYDGYEALDPKVWLPELAKTTRGRAKKLEYWRRRDPIWREGAKALAQPNALLQHLRLRNMTAREIAEMESKVKRARIIAENSEKDRLRAAIRSMAKQHGLNVEDLISR